MVKEVFLVHGFTFNPRDNQYMRNVGQALEKEGYKVRYLDYHWNDPASIAMLQLRLLLDVGKEDVVIGHSLGGIMTDLNPFIKARTIDVNSLTSDLHSTRDWLTMNRKKSKAYQGGSHSMDDVAIEAVIQELDTIDPVTGETQANPKIQAVVDLLILVIELFAFDPWGGKDIFGLSPI